MGKADSLIQDITAAFANVEKPPSWCLSNSREGEEPAVLEQEFAEIPAWNTLSADFLDNTPNGFGTALSFFSDEAYRYYLPAYLIASLQNKLQRVDPVFYLTHGLEDSSAEKLLNPRRYGSRSWGDYARYRHSVFNEEQATAISGYLKHQAKSGNRTEFEQQLIKESLTNYWKQKANASNNRKYSQSS